MLYGVLGGFGLFVLLPFLIALYFMWPSYMYSKTHPFFQKEHKSRKQMTMADFTGMGLQLLQLIFRRMPPKSLRKSCGMTDLKKRRFLILHSRPC